MCKDPLVYWFIEITRFNVNHGQTYKLASTQINKHFKWTLGSWFSIELYSFSKCFHEGEPMQLVVKLIIAIKLRLEKMCVKETVGV